MSEQQSTRLQEVIRDSVAKIERFKDRGLGEQNTKASIIEPMLEALGWAIRDPDEVHREFRSNPKDSPVDYSLALMRKPRFFVCFASVGSGRMLRSG
jgi:predicted type IV restriction endonuclease